VPLPPKTREAEQFVADLLADADLKDNYELPAKDVEALAFKEGISKSALDRAKKKASIRSEKEREILVCWFLDSRE
jgi:hypothetical protein